jgi:uncharacterized ion transporter superfamily protein YfcC
MFKRFPHTFVIIFYIIILAAVCTWIIPGGQYTEKILMADGTEQKVMQFQYTENVKQSWQIFSSLFKGFQRQSGIIVFVLIVGGAFWIMNESKSIDAGIFAFLRFTRRMEHLRLLRLFGINNIILVLIMVMFSMFGAVYGMSEETIAFIIILVPLAISMGYDSITGVAIVFVAAGLGFAGALLNPFTIGIAQGIAGLPVFSGIEYRLLCWIIINLAGIWYIIRYASRISKNPEKSPVYQEDEYWRKTKSETGTRFDYHTPLSAWFIFVLIVIVLVVISFGYKLTPLKIGNISKSVPVIPVLTALFVLTGMLSLRKSVHFFILLLLLFTILFLMVGVMGYQWFIMELATLFLAMGLAAGIAYNNSPNKIVKLFLEGVKDILPAALVVGLAGGIIVILEDGKIIDTILYKLSQSMESMGKVGTVGMMYVIQTIINIAIPSGSAKAALTMPIMAPFSDLVGLSKQATVMAYQFGDGFTNMITPTSGILIGVLGIARIPYSKWVKWITPMMIILVLLGFLMLIPTVTMSLPGF